MKEPAPDEDRIRMLVYLGSGEGGPRGALVKVQQLYPLLKLISIKHLIAMIKALVATLQ